MGWAATEFETIDLGDERRNKRAIRLVERLSAQPTASVPQACGDWADTIAAYRFFNNEAVDWRAILGAHTDCAMTRMAAHEVVLCIQDTTALDFTSQPGIAGLGRLSYEAITWLVCPSDLGGHAPRAGAGGGGCLDLGARA